MEAICVELKKTDLKIFQDCLRKLRSSNDFREELIESIQTLTSEIGDYDFNTLKALLILAVNKRYEKTIERDMVLVAWGLLDEYDNRDDERGKYNGKTLLYERRKKFIKNSQYLQIQYNGSYTDLINNRLLNKKGKRLTLKTAISTLGSADGRCINQVAEKIHENFKKYVKYIEEHPEEYFKNSDPKCELKLPLIEHPLADEDGHCNKTNNENTTTKRTEDTANPDEDDGEKITVIINSEKDKDIIQIINARKRKKPLYIILAVLILSLIILVGYAYPSVSNEDTSGDEEPEPTLREVPSSIYINEEHFGVLEEPVQNIALNDELN